MCKGQTLSLNYCNMIKVLKISKPQLRNNKDKNTKRDIETKSPNHICVAWLIILLLLYYCIIGSLSEDMSLPFLCLYCRMN